MKKKPLTTILLIAVVVIWAWIMYSVFDYMRSPEIRVVGKKDFVSIASNDTISIEYMLQLNYKDPFLKKDLYLSKTTGQSLSNNNSISNVNRVSIKRQVKESEKEEIPIPTVDYVGRIHNEKLKKPIAILVIDNKEYMMQEGETHDGVLLKQIMNDSIKAIFSKKVFYVKKQ